MKMKIIFILIATISICFIDQNLQSKLKDFKEGIKKEEKERREKEKYKSNSDSEDDEDDDKSCSGMGVALGTCLDFFMKYNITIHYTDYPYDKKDSENHFIKDSSESETVSDDDKEKSYYFSFLAAGYWSRNTGFGLITGFRGKFWKVIGPEIETRDIWEGNDHLGYYGLGINLSLVQHDFFIFDLYVQAALMRGILNRTGGTYGAIFISYPVKPLSLTLKIGGVHFKYVDMMNLEFRMGIHVDRVEFFAGYRLLYAKYSELDGPFIGIQVFI